MKECKYQEDLGGVEENRVSGEDDEEWAGCEG